MAKPMRRARYDPDPKKFRALMMGPEMQKLLADVARTRGIPAAQADAPTDTGEYRESFTVDTGISAVGDRAEARLINTAPHAKLVELKHDVLAKAVDAIEAP